MTALPDLLAQSPLLAGLDRQALRTIAGTLIEERWPAGRQIIGPSETIEAFRLVVEGRLKIAVSNSGDGRELTLWLYGPREGFDAPERELASMVGSVRIVVSRVRLSELSVCDEVSRQAEPVEQPCQAAARDDREV